ncbi:protein containing DUF433 [Beggiatoa sp. PS]|nr:protein containing DUF433 [Beggiatoa sp. PS]
MKLKFGSKKKQIIIKSITQDAKVPALVIPKIGNDESKHDSEPSIATRYEHISFDENHVPIIAGTKIKVVEIVLDKIAYGWSPEEIHFQHPHLTLGQIYSALAYYCDHQAEVEQDIERRLKFVDQLQKNRVPSAIKTRLKAQELI